MICSSCKFCYDERWIRSGCRLALGCGKRWAFVLLLLCFLLQLHFIIIYLLLHLSSFLSLRPLSVSSVIVTITMIATSLTTIIIPISVPASPHMTLSWLEFRRQRLSLLLRFMNRLFFLQSCMKFLLSLCPPSHMSHAKFAHFWPKSSLQSCNMLVSMVYGVSLACLFFQKLSLDPHPEVGGRNGML